MDAVSVVSSASLNRSIDFHTRPSAASTRGGGRRGNSSSSSSGMVQKNNNNNNNNSNNSKWAAMGTDGCPPPPPATNTTTRRPSYDISGRSEISVGTDLSTERPCTRDTASLLLMRDASTLSGLSGQPDKSNFREKMRNWAVCEDAAGGAASRSPYLLPRPTTSLADQKPTIVGVGGGPGGSGCPMSLMGDVEREMSFLLSRPSTTSTFPSKPKELVEPLEGLLPDERPVSQKKFLVLPSIGRRQRGHHPRDLFLRRQRSNLETVNQLDYSRTELEENVNFFSDYYHHSPSPSNNGRRRQKHHQTNHHHQQKQQQQQQQQQRSQDHHHHYREHQRSQGSQHHHDPHHHHQHQHQMFSDDDLTDPEDLSDYYENPRFSASSTTTTTNNNTNADPRESPTKAGKVGTPMPLPPIHKLQWERLRAQAGLTELTEENAYALFSRGESRVSRGYSNDNDDEDDDEDDLEEFRLKTPETYRSDSPTKTDMITPPPGFR